nr:MFS transporter [Candidatus Njordarchaeum guaymaensis]
MSKRFFVMLCVMGLFAILSSTMSKNPVLRPFAESLGTPEFLMGFVASASTIPGILASLPAGTISDRLGRRKVIFFSGAIFASAPFLYLFVVNPFQLILVRFYHGFATAIFGPVAKAAIVERYPQSKGEKVSLFSSVSDVGRTIAPTIGGYVLLVTASNYYELYLTVGVAGVLALLVATGLRERKEGETGKVPRTAEKTKPVTMKGGVKWSQSAARDWKEVASNAGILAASLAEAAQYYTFGAFEFYMVAYAKSLGIDILLIGIISSVQIVTFVIGKPLMGRLSDRIGRKRPIILGLVIGGISMVATQFAVSFPELVLVSITYGLSFSLVTSSTPALVSELCRKEVYGSAMGFLSTIMDVGQTLGPIATGLIIATGFGYSGSFTSLGLVLLVSCMVLYVSLRKKIR